jgi:hypothetical protein
VKRNIYKLTVLHEDLNGSGPYLPGEKVNDRDFMKVMDVEPREVDWTDEHPLNQRDTQRQAFDELFTPPVGQRLTVYGDTELMDLVKQVNKALETHGLVFQDHSADGADHLEYVLARL